MTQEIIEEIKKITIDKYGSLECGIVSMSEMPVLKASAIKLFNNKLGKIESLSELLELSSQAEKYFGLFLTSNSKKSKPAFNFSFELHNDKCVIKYLFDETSKPFVCF